jgi:hypothetical protein
MLTARERPVVQVVEVEAVRAAPVVAMKLVAEPAAQPVLVPVAVQRVVMARRQAPVAVLIAETLFV